MGIDTWLSVLLYVSYLIDLFVGLNIFYSGIEYTELFFVLIKLNFM